MKIVYKNDWMRIINIGDQYFIQYNSGDLINSVREIEISKSDAMIAQKSEQSAYEVIIKYENLQN